MENFKFDIELLKVAISYVAAFFAAHFAGSYKHIIVLIIFILTDTAIGWLVYKKLGQWQSSKARWGFVGKIAELTLVSLLYMLDWLFETDC
ncbi:MAG: phage holin family protein, partial [Lachnospirales bacterium]